MKTENQTPISYQDPAPDWYRCDRCERQRRLFRPYNDTSRGKMPLLCRKHARKAAKRADPSFTDQNYPRSVGWWVLAVPVEDGVGFWGCTAIPEEGLKWWERLP